MILLDTNVISEAMRPAPHPGVIRWLDEQPAHTLYLSSVALAELLFGIAALPAGKRKNALGEALNGLTRMFDGRILPLDVPAARCYAELASRARSAGQMLPRADGYIAAIAAAHGFAVATRDVGPYLAAGLQVINPWQP